MKILHLISGGDVGGAKTHVLTLLQGLGKSETVRLVCFTDGQFAEEARALQIDTQILPGGLKTTVRKLCDMIRCEQFQIVHCHGSRANMTGAILRKMIRVPIVTTVHSDYRLDYLGRPLHRLTYGTINTVALRLFDYHIGVSDAMAQLLISRGFDAQTMFSIYNGVDFSPRTPKLSRAQYLAAHGVENAEDCVIFGIAARLSAVKDVGTLILAFGKAAGKNSSIRLLIAGDGEQSEELHRLADSVCPKGSCVFVGWESDMDSFYHALDVNTLTSLSETFPYALTEGARMHCATIASNVGGVPYLIENGVTGLLFEARDDERLCSHILQLAENEPLRRQLAESLYEKASDKFSIGATVAHQLEIYDSILRRESAPKQKKNGVLICGAYGKGNAGDDAILKAILRQMHEISADMPIYVLSHNPMETKLRYHVGAVHAFDPFAFIPLMHKTKLFISGGGSLIQDQTSSRSLLYYLFTVYLAKCFGSRVLMYGCGIGPVQKKRNRRLAARIINSCVDAITLREDLSAKELQSMGVTKPKVYVTADPALLLKPGSEHAIDSYLLGNGLDPNGGYALFVLRPWQGFAQKQDAIAKTAQYVFDRYGLKPVFFALEPNRDTAACMAVAEKLSCESCLLSTPQDEKYIIGMLKKMKLVVSMRLHTLIFASSVGTPLVALSYDPKVTGFMHYIGQKHCVAFEDADEEKLKMLTDCALNETEPYSVSHLHELAEANADVARELLEG